MNKENLLKEILICLKANEVYVTGDMVFALAFRTEDELIQIAKELGIKVNK